MDNRDRTEACVPELIGRFPQKGQRHMLSGWRPAHSLSDVDRVTWGLGVDEAQISQEKVGWFTPTGCHTTSPSYLFALCDRYLFLS